LRNRAEPSPWISHPAIDLGLISFGWIPLLFAFILANQSEDSEGWRASLLVLVLAVNFLHRHITFPLVYGDPDIYGQRRRSYLGLPLLFAAITLGCVSWVDHPRLVGEPMADTVELRDQAFITVGFWRDGKRGPPFRVDLGGSSTPEDVRAAFDDALEGRLIVRLEAGALTLQLPPNSADKAFIVAGRKGTHARKAIGLDPSGMAWFRSSRPLFTGLAILSVIWTIYHTLMQKYGLLRIYSRKSSQQTALNDQLLVFAWFFVVLLGLLATPSVRELAADRFSQWETIFAVTKPILGAMPVLAILGLVGAIGVTISFVRAELAGGLSIPKLAAIGSLLALYAAMFWDPVAGYLLFGFSHSVEYLAFVNVFSRKKYLDRDPTSSAMARAISLQPLSLGVFMVGGGAIYLFWQGSSALTLEWYIVGSSFLHFLYDGWIWKVSKPEVARPLAL
jgi:hypothetical protein